MALPRDRGGQTRTRPPGLAAGGGGAALARLDACRLEHLLRLLDAGGGGVDVEVRDVFADFLGDLPFDFRGEEGCGDLKRLARVFVGALNKQPALALEDLRRATLLQPDLSVVRDAFPCRCRGDDRGYDGRDDCWHTAAEKIRSYAQDHRDAHAAEHHDHAKSE